MNAFASHSRAGSDDTRSSGASYHLILEHILAYPGTYEIPLRTMYTLNCAPRAQPLPSHLVGSGSPATHSATHPQEGAAESGAAQFTSSLMNQISQLPSQPCSLPPVFIVPFVKRTFVTALELVDFPQALTALDYLKDLEMRRRRAIAGALGRLGVERDTLGSNPEELARRSPQIARWVKGIESSERKVEALYTQLYVAIRRWIMINELMIRPFSKQSCVAMLNTLYPPVSPVQPTAALTPAVMKTQRDGFFKYVQAVEKSGNTTVLEGLMQQGKRTQDENGWPAVRDTVDRYLRVANSLIEECGDISSADDLNKEKELDGAQDMDGKRKERKADSGVSFASRDRHSATGSTVSTTSATYMNKSLPSAPCAPVASSTAIHTPLVQRNHSTLEKIAMELRRFKMRHKTDDSINKENHSPSQSQSSNSPHMTDDQPTLHKSKSGRSRSGSLRKLKSLGDLRNGSRANSSHGKNDSDTPSFDKEEMRRQRLIYEANASKNGGAQKVTSSFEF